MQLRRLGLINYRNYESVNLEFTSKINVLVGVNGSGKTNLLDAIYYLSYTKSSLQPVDPLNIRHGQDHFLIQGAFEMAEGAAILTAAFQPGARKSIKENGAEYRKLSDHIGSYPVVLMAPDDVDIIREGSETRRKFFDGLISQIDRDYLENLMGYNQLLKQRNGLLRLFHQTGLRDWVALESYDHMLAVPGQRIYEKRKLFMDRFIPVFNRYFEFLVKGIESASVTYVSGLDETDTIAGCQRFRERDLALQRTGFGIHKDDYRFLLGSEDMKKFASQGQQKTMVIALRLAQWELIREEKGFRPVLLLDDIFDKLDDYRIERLLELVKNEFGQLFVTDARPGRTADLLRKINASVSVFTVDDGKIDLTQ
jgi:DNA replication and repair protein RecF